MARVALAGAVLLAGCGNPRNSSTPAGDTRFELKHDQEGRLVRLDKATGEVTVVEEAPTRVEPATNQARKRRRPTVAAPTGPSHIPPSACGNEHVRIVSVTASTAAVFVRPQILPTPLITFETGAQLPVVKTEGTWFYVRFDDRRWGPRFGYIRCADVTPATAVDTP
jgi:hypothetical protein